MVETAHRIVVSLDPHDRTTEDGIDPPRVSGASGVRANVLVLVERFREAGPRGTLR